MWILRYDLGKVGTGSSTEWGFLWPVSRLLCNSKKSILNYEMKSDDEWRKV